jgi:hypothetical protein
MGLPQSAQYKNPVYAWGYFFYPAVIGSGSMLQLCQSLAENFPGQDRSMMVFKYDLLRLFRAPVHLVNALPLPETPAAAYRYKNHCQ